jgi:hypothetical protein
MPGFTHVPVTAYDVQRPTYRVRCTLTFVVLSVFPYETLDTTLDITHFLMCEINLLAFSGLSWFTVPLVFWLATPGCHTIKVCTSVQPSPGAHRRCYLSQFYCSFAFYLLRSGLLNA